MTRRASGCGQRGCPRREGRAWVRGLGAHPTPLNANTWEKSDDELANPHKYREAEIREMNGASPASTWM